MLVITNTYVLKNPCSSKQLAVISELMRLSLSSITMHVTLDHYKEKKEEENLYSKWDSEATAHWCILVTNLSLSLMIGDVNFITDQEDCECTCSLLVNDFLTSYVDDPVPRMTLHDRMWGVNVECAFELN